MPSEMYKRKLALREERPKDYQTPAHWPRNVLLFSLDDEILGVDENNNLYVDGKKVEVARTLTLSGWQTTFIAVGAGSTFAIAVVEFLRMYWSLQS